MHNAQTSTSGWKTGSRLHFCEAAWAEPCPPRTGTPKEKKETEASYRPAQVEEDWAALPGEEAQPPSPIPSWRRRVTGLVNL